MKSANWQKLGVWGTQLPTFLAGMFAASCRCFAAAIETQMQMFEIAPLTVKSQLGSGHNILIDRSRGALGGWTAGCGALC